MIGIIDYGMGNLQSALNALEALGRTAALVRTAAELADCERLILPGVGAYAQAMVQLRSRGLDAAVRQQAQAGKPLLGICLGMQILASRGTEPTATDGLDLIPGTVERLEVPAGLRLPHVGWNSLELARAHPVLDGIKPGVDFYFVHSYHFLPARPADVVGCAEYGVKFAAVIARDSAVGVQFHPEKSQNNGLKILDNFCDWDGRC